MAMEWKEIYSCRIPDIDNQHKRLFEIGNQLYTLALKTDVEQKSQKVNAIMSELQAYTIYHFEFEEKLIANFGYPDVEKHRMEHQKFITALSEMEVNALKSGSDDMILKLIMFVSEWISNHIVISDMKYVKFYEIKKDLKTDN